MPLDTGLSAVYRDAITYNKGLPLIHRRTALERFEAARREWIDGHPDASPQERARYDELYRMCIKYSDPEWRNRKAPQPVPRPAPEPPPRWKVTSKRKLKPGDPEIPPDDYSIEDGPVPTHRIYVRVME